MRKMANPSNSDRLDPNNFQDANQQPKQPTPNPTTTGRALYYRSVDDGYWVAFLLPVALYISDFDLNRDTITAVSIITINAFLLCMYRWLELNFYMLLQRMRKMCLSISGVVLLACIIHGGVDIYEIASYLALHFTFPYLFYNLIKQHPRSFSFGEGVLVTSAFAYKFWGATQSLPFPKPGSHINKMSEDDLLYIFLQLVFFGTILGARVILLMQKPWKLFILEEMLCLWSKYCVLAFFTRIPTENDEVSIFLLMWPFKFLFANRLRVSLVIGWAVICLLTGLFFFLKSLFYQRATIVDRKIFHIAVVVVFLPGIAMDHSLVFCCSAVVFFLLILAETLRVLKFEILGVKIGKMMNDKVIGFRDQQDEGRLLLTPIYLLVGCAAPIWLTEVQGKKLNSIQYAACIAGILSIGIGDTFASIGGSYYGRMRWGDSRKTMEGTFCSILSQLLFIVLVFSLGVLPYDSVSVTALIAGIITNAVVEGNTSQIDNLVLPLLTFIVIHGSSFLHSFLYTTKNA